jgi:hypothetical protein
MYALISNGQIEKYPYSIGLLRKNNPQTSFPANPSNERLAEWNVFPVQPTDRPEVDYTKNVNEATPTQQDGKWVQVWDVTNATAEEISQRTEEQASSIRSERDQKLFGSDWVVIRSIETEVPEIELWKAYRQALRDVPQQAGFPWAVVWPARP